MNIKKNELRYAVDTLLFLCVVGMVLIGIIIGILIPEGPSVHTGDKYFLDLHRHQWGKIHLYLSFTFTGLLVVHLILSWKWITAQARNIFKKGWISVLSITALASLLVLFLFWQFTPKHAQKYVSYGGGQEGKGRLVQLSGHDRTSPSEEPSENRRAAEITGRTTLRDLENMTGVPLQAVLEELGLPGNTSPENTLGRLRNLYGFSLADVRKAISRRLEESPPLKNEPGSEAQAIAPAKQTGQEDHDRSDNLPRGRLSEDQTGVLIVGSMTFRQVESETGIPAARIIHDIGLPETIPLDETLGRLRKKYGFTMQEVRDIVASYLEKKGGRS